MLCCPVTSKVKGGSFEVPLQPGGGLHGGVLSDRIRNLDWIVRRTEFREKARADVLDGALGRVMAILGG